MTVYRHAAVADWRAIANLHAESWRATYRGAYSDEYLDGPVFAEREQVWRVRLSAPPRNQFVVVAEADNGIIGFACAYGDDDERWGTLLDNIHVSPGLHRRGVGTRLVTQIAVWCRSHHPDSGLYLWVLGQNTDAQRFYERLGATDRLVEHRPPPIGGGGPRPVHLFAWSCLEDVRA